MPKVIFVDKHIRNRQGHHLEYCLRAIQGFKKAGWQTSIVCNKQFTEKLADIETCPVIEFAPRNSNSLSIKQVLAAKFLAPLQNISTVVEHRLIYSPLGKLLSMMLDLRSGFRVNLRAQKLSTIFLVVLLGLVAPVLISMLFCFKFLALLVRAPLRKVTSFLKKKVYHRLRGSLVAIISHIRTVQPEGGKQARQISNALKKLGVTEQDIVVFSTFTPSDLGVLLKLTEHAGKNFHCHSWNVIFREPLFLNEVHQLQLAPEHRLLRSMMMKIARTGANVRYWVDTPGLARQYNLLSVAEFGVLPVVVPDSLADLAIATEAYDHNRPVRFGYIGDARQEKGFGLLPGMIEQIHRHDAVKVKSEFYIQSNYNVPGGYPLTRAAKLKLLFQRNLGVHLIDKMLTSEQYLELLGKVDVVLLPYRHPSYCIGSSGIVVEALAAGRPVVATEYAWGGRQVRESQQFRRHVDGFVVRYKKEVLSDMHLPDHPTRIDIPEGTTHLAISMTSSMASVGDVLHITVEQHGADNQFLGRRRRYFAGKFEKTTALWELHPGTTSVLIDPYRLDLMLNNENCKLEVIACFVPDTAAVSLDAVGALIDEPADLETDTTDFARGVSDMLRHFSHFRATAMEHAEGWRQLHSADNLVTALISGKSIENALPASTDGVDNTGNLAVA